MLLIVVSCPQLRELLMERCDEGYSCVSTRKSTKKIFLLPFFGTVVGVLEETREKARTPPVCRT